MTILAIGGTGRIGSLVVEELARRGAQVRALGTKLRPGGTPSGVEPVIGDVLDVDFTRGQLRSVSTVFALHPAVADELTSVLLTLALIEEAGIKRIVYLSMIGADRFADSPRAAAKLAAEETIARRASRPRSCVRTPCSRTTSCRRAPSRPTKPTRPRSAGSASR